MLQFFLVIVLCVLPVGIVTGYTKSSAVEGLSILGGLHLAAIALFAITEEHDVSRRVTHQIRTVSGWRRLWIFRPGGAGGTVYVLVLMLLFLFARGSIYFFSNTISYLASGIPLRDNYFSFFVVICGYVCFFSGVPTLFVRRWASPLIKTVHLRIGIILLTAAASILPDFIVFLGTGKWGGGYSVRHILNPFRTLDVWHDPQYEPYHILVYGLCLTGFISYLLLIIFGWQRKSPATARRKSNDTAHWKPNETAH